MKTNYHRPTTEKLTLLAPGSVRQTGDFARRIDRITQGLLLRIPMEETVAFFAERRDLFAAGELWGKLVRAGALLAAYGDLPALREKLKDTVRDLLDCETSDGCISCVPRELQPNGTHGSDLWERKYVLLGLLGYYDLTGDKAVLDGAVRLALYTARQVGPAPRTPITQTGWAFYGIESSSILEPIMRLYRLSGEPELLDFGRYIVECGGCARDDIFSAPLRGVSPADVGSDGDPRHSIAKAYEMTSCFEGLLEFYLATGDPDALRAAEAYAALALRDEITYLGSGGANGYGNLGPGDGEQWNHTAHTQTDPRITLTMETCVTVTWAKFLLRLWRTTADVKWLECAETALSNALPAAMKPDGSGFDYFIRFNGKRGSADNFAYPVGGIPISCCTANGPMGLAQVPAHSLVRSPEGLLLALFERGEYDADEAAVSVEGDLLAEGAVRVPIRPKRPFRFAVRVPSWLDGARVEAGGREVPQKDGVAALSVDSPVTVTLTGTPRLTCRVAPDDPSKVLFIYGSIVLSRDIRFAAVPGRPVDPDTLSVPSAKRAPDGALLVRLGDDVFCDYAHAGQGRGEDGIFETWLPLAR